MKLKNDLFEIITAAIDSVKPENLIPQKVSFEGRHLVIDNYCYDLRLFENVFVIGAGKASAAMAFELEKLCGDIITSGIVSTKYCHSFPCKKVRVIESGHPIIDDNSLKAGNEILNLAEQANENDLVICLLSGGASALLEKLPDEFSLEELQKVFQLLLNCGANIEEINVVRRHLSKIKGGNLAKAIYPATCLSLILSDVINDPLEAISGGVTAPDPSTFQDALKVLSKYKIQYQIPSKILHYLESGIKKTSTETLKPGDKIFEKVTHIIIGNNKRAVETAKQKAEILGYNVLIYSENIQGEAKEVGKALSYLTKRIISENEPVQKPACILLGGETTVSIKGKGKGGRNQELVLSSLINMSDCNKNYLIASIGTDGTDGPTDAAGAFANFNIAFRAKELGLDGKYFLSNNDSYNFFERTGGLIKTGPTGTNVMDLIFALVE